MNSLLTTLALLVLGDFPRFEAQQIDPHAGEIVYAVTVADVNGDKKPDVVAVTEDAVLWYENPSWAKHVITQGKTARDNVCIQAHDIDGDGQIDFALGAGWKPPDTKTASTLQWLGRDAKGQWQIHPIHYEEPALHRIRWGDVLNNGKMQLVVTPLQGRGTKGPNWGEGSGAKMQVFSIPKDPTSPDWPSEVAEDSLHTTHNLEIVDIDGDKKNEILIASWEGVYFTKRSPDGKWSRTKIGSGNQDSKPFKGASEVKVGHFFSRFLDHTVITIEPWHGSQVVMYGPGVEKTTTGDVRFNLLHEWYRKVLAEPLSWGHAVWCADLDGDGDDEIVIGQRDPNKEGSPKGPGVFVFDIDREPKHGKTVFTRHTIDDGVMACEDALAADLDGDGRPEIIAGGRATHNVKIYWNKSLSDKK